MTTHEIAQKLVCFRKIYIRHPREVELFNTLDLMRAQARLSLEGPYQGLKFISPSFAGKSTSLEIYTERANRDQKMGGPVLYVALEGDTTPKGLFVMLAKGLGDPLAERGTYLELQRRVYDACRERQVELIIIDEINHLVMVDTEKAAWRVTETLKRMLEDGVAPIVLAGMERAEPLFTSNRQLNNRLRQPFSFKHLNLEVDADLKYAAKFLNRLDEEMVANDICQELSGLAEHALPWAIFSAGDGYIGRSKNVVERALEFALLKGSRRIEVSHLHQAVEQWAVGLGLRDRNDFDQLLDIKVAA